MIFGKFNPAATILLGTNWATMFAPPPLLHAHWGTANGTRKWKRWRRIKQQTLLHRWEFWREANLPLNSTVKGQEVIKERTGQWWCQETPLRHELKHCYERDNAQEQAAQKWQSQTSEIFKTWQNMEWCCLTWRLDLTSELVLLWERVE